MRLAPSDSRMPSSLCRDAARASCRLATFAQAITSTIPTAAIISKIAYSSPPYNFNRVRKRGARPDHCLGGFTQIGVRVVQGTELAGNQGHLRLRLIDADSGS